MINVDVAGVKDGSEAKTLMFHHLALAASYFEAAGCADKPAKVPDHFSRVAMKAWLLEMEAIYKRWDV